MHHVNFVGIAEFAFSRFSAVLIKRAESQSQNLTTAAVVVILVRVCVSVFVC